MVAPRTHLSLLAIVLFCSRPGWVNADDGAWLDLRPDPAEVVGPTECGDCHEAEHEVWLGTAHATGFRDLARNPKAREISSALGIRRIKRDPSCTSCHFLTGMEGPEARPIAGVSCESCHGAGREWVEIHWDFGPAGATRETETEEHRKARLASCEQQGMRSPHELLGLASACYGCHVVADERLVNVGGHPQPKQLDLLAAMEGGLRHNFVRGDGENGFSSAERRRDMHVVGLLLDLEASLRALAKAREDGPHSRGLIARIQADRERLGKITDVAPIPGVADVLQASDVQTLEGNGSAKLTAAAERVAATTTRFLAAARSGDLKALDSLISRKDGGA